MTRFPAIRGLLFDKDGTLFDFTKSWAGWLRAYLDELAPDSADLRAALAASVGFDPIAGRFAPDSPVIAATATEISACMAPHLPHMTQSQIIAANNASAARAQMAPAVPLVPLFTRLKAAGYAIGLATNDAEHAARNHLENHKLTAFFDRIHGYDSGFGAKPAPGMCLAFAEKLGLDPAACIMVGDSRHDLQAGRAAGMRTVAVLTGVAVAADLSDLADAVLPDIGALPEWLGLPAAAS